MGQKKLKGISLSFISLILLGILPIISNSRSFELNALDFTLLLTVWQLIFATPVFLIEYKFFDKGIFSKRLPKRQIIKTLLIIFVTGILFGISTYFYVLSMEKAGTVSASIAIQAYPLFSILLETIFLRKIKNIYEIMFTLLLILGLYFLGTSGTWKIEGLSIWFLFALSIPFIWSVAHIIVKEVLNNTKITPAQVTFLRVLVSTVIILMISFYGNGYSIVSFNHWNIAFQKYAIIMGLVYYLELINWFYAVKYIDVSLASSITTPWPIVTTILAVFFLEEKIYSYQIITLGIVCFSVYGIIWAGNIKKRIKLI